MNLYEVDYFKWTQDTADRLRRREFSQVDISALIEEVEDLGKGHKSVLISRFEVLIAHLLKWDCQPAKRSVSWQATIQLQRRKIARLLSQSASLQPFLNDSFADAYSDAVLRSISETGLDRKHFPETCPYSVEEILSTKEVCAHC